MGVQCDDSEAESMSLLVSGTFIETSTGVEVLDTRWISDYALSDVYAHSLMEVSSRLMLFFARVTQRVGTRAPSAQFLSQPQQQPPSQPQPQPQLQPSGDVGLPSVSGVLLQPLLLRRVTLLL